MIKFKHEKLHWECECCGSGCHTKLTISREGKEDKIFSYNDQFGESLSKQEHEELPRFLHNLESDGYSFNDALVLLDMLDIKYEVEYV